jgi:uncharacterized membrane protein
MTARRIVLAFVFLWFLLGGIGHFALADVFVRIVPPYIPFPLAAVYLSGVAELAGAAGILVPRTRALAGIGLMALTVCVTPANVYMWMNPQLFPAISETALVLRLLFQPVLIAGIWWSTRTATRS